MDDKELLERAAKVAGYVVTASHRDECCLLVRIDGARAVWWNPLIDDGDALRLAVKLDMEVNLNRVDEITIVCFGYFACRKVKEEHGPDPYAATRRAIVRAAAALVS